MLSLSNGQNLKRNIPTPSDQDINSRLEKQKSEYIKSINLISRKIIYLRVPVEIGIKVYVYLCDTYPSHS